MVGTTASTDFPTANAYQSSVSGYSNNHVFVTKLNPSGSSLDYSTYLAGTSADQGSGIAVDAAVSALRRGLDAVHEFPDDERGLSNQPGGVTAAAPTPL